MAYRLVPERRVLVPGTSREIVIPPYYERLQPDGSWQAPPVTGYGTRGEGPVYVPEPRQAAPCGPDPMLDAVGMNEINRIFEVIDGLGIHREHVVIPLGTGTGRVRRLPSGKLEIIVDAEAPFEEWVAGLPALIEAAQAR